MGPDRLLDKVIEVRSQGIDRMILKIPRRRRTSDTVVVLPKTSTAKRVMGTVVGSKRDELIVSVHTEDVWSYLISIAKEVE